MGDPSYEITRVNNGDRVSRPSRRGRKEEKGPERIVVTKFRNNFRVRSCNRPLLHHSRFPEHRVRPSFADHRPVPLNARCIFYAIEGKKKGDKKGEEKGRENNKIPRFGEISQFHGKTSRRLWNDHDDRNKRREKKREKRKKLFLLGKPLEGLDRLSSTVATGVGKSIR